MLTVPNCLLMLDNAQPPVFSLSHGEMRHEGMHFGTSPARFHMLSTSKKQHYQGIKRLRSGLSLQSLPDCISQACFAAALVLGVQAQRQVVLCKRLLDSASYVQYLQPSRETALCPADVREIDHQGLAHKADRTIWPACRKCLLCCCRKALCSKTGRT